MFVLSFGVAFIGNIHQYSVQGYSQQPTECDIYDNDCLN